MTLAIATCLAASLAILALLRRDRLSLGLPIAYLGSLLLAHLPGAFVHAVSPQPLAGDRETTIGIGYTAVGAVCFVLGVWLARLQRPVTSSKPAGAASRDSVAALDAAGAASDLRAQGDFRLFCLFGGWLFVYGLTPLVGVPSVAAAIDKGGAIWLLGVMLGLRAALLARRPRATILWLAALSVYPVLTLLLGGFAASGTTAVIIVASTLGVQARRQWRVIAGAVLIAVTGVSLSTSYLEHRGDIRAAVWGRAPLAQRLGAVGEMLADIHLFDPNRADDVGALNARLNQNFFVGLSAERIRQGDAHYLNGSSVTDGLLALIPRIVWPEKPVYGGSPKIVAEMTGLDLSTTTSWGVGNVMEFYINFGMAGIVVGFMILGGLLGWLDMKAAAAERCGDYGGAILFFLPALALIQPLGSLVELSSGAAAALLAAVGWRFAWRVWSARRAGVVPSTGRRGQLRANWSR